MFLMCLTQTWAKPDPGAPTPSEPALINNELVLPMGEPPPQTTAMAEPTAKSDTDWSRLQERLATTERLRQLEVEAANERHREARRVSSLATMLMALVLPIAFAAGVFYARYKNYQQLNEKLRRLVEKGIPIPPELLAPTASHSDKPRLSNAQSGLLLILAGLGTMLFLATSFGGHGGPPPGLGLIPLFIGLGYLLLSRFERRKDGE